MRKPLSYVLAVSVGVTLGVGIQAYTAEASADARSLEQRVAVLERLVTRPLRPGVGSINDARGVVRNWCVFLRHSNATKPREIGDSVADLLLKWRLSCSAFSN